MNQDATWYGGKSRLRRLYVRWGPSSPKKGQPQFSANVYCGQTADGIKMPLGAEVGLGPVDIVLDGAQLPASLQKRGTAPIFGPRLLWPNGRPSQLLLSTVAEMGDRVHNRSGPKK